MELDNKRPADREDDLSIPNSDRLFRRLPPQFRVERDGKIRPSSSAFKNEELSVNLESLMGQIGRAPSDIATAHPKDALVSIVAGDVRHYKYPIVKDTDPPNEPDHGLVLGKKTDGFANAMVRSHVWISDAIEK